MPSDGGNAICDALGSVLPGFVGLCELVAAIAPVAWSLIQVLLPWVLDLLGSLLG